MNSNHPEEFIGLRIKVMRTKNKSLEGIEGVITDETKSTFRILIRKNEEKIILKKGVTFEINNKVVDGDSILLRPEERIKLKKQAKNKENR